MSRALPLRKKRNSGIRSSPRYCETVFGVMFDDDTCLLESVPRAVSSVGSTARRARYRSRRRNPLQTKLAANIDILPPPNAFVFVGFHRHYRRYELRLSELRKFISTQSTKTSKSSAPKSSDFRLHLSLTAVTEYFRLGKINNNQGNQVAEIPIDFVIAERRSDPASSWGLALFS